VKEILYVGKSCGVEVSKIAVKIMRVGPIAKRHRRQIEPGKTAVGLVHDVDADFFFDHIALIAQIFVVNFEGAHAIGFEPEHAFQSIGRNGFKIIGDVVVGGAVEHSAGGIDQANVFHFSGVGRTLKHHVLKKVSETAAPEWFEAKTDLIVDTDGDNRGRAIRGNDDAQTIGKSGVFDWDMQILHFDFLRDFPSTRFKSFKVAPYFFDNMRADNRASA
jgi:hypothetical protein